MRSSSLVRGSLFLLVLVGAGLVLAQGVGEPAPAPPEPPPDPIAGLGYRVTRGAAPGYVEDRACGGCHQDLYASYQAVGMARSFFRPAVDKDVEDFSALPFVSGTSGERYRIERAGERLVFHRWQVAEDGSPINSLEQDVDWVMGSGNHSRTYLFRNPAGELYLLPLAWYSQTGRWAYAPGFEIMDPPVIARAVQRECMFCHNAYPDVPAGSDRSGAPHLFPPDLPEGTGCQRCHGPGAEHVRRAGAADTAPAALAASIVNPARLAPERRDDVCYECHLQPAVALSSMRRFGRGDYSFRPGEDLADYRVELDIVVAGEEAGERFEINHHPVRLEQSACFRESAGRLSCLTCHDPHRKVPPSERAAHYRQACLGCHGGDGLAGHPPVPGAGGAEGGAELLASDCTVCHMPERRTQDVVEVTMTDHLIRRGPGGPELLAPLAQKDPVIEDVVFYHPERAPPGAKGDLYRAAAVLRALPGHAEAAGQMERLLATLRPESADPYLRLAQSHLARGRPAAALGPLAATLERDAGNLLATRLQALAWVGTGAPVEGLGRLRRLAELFPDDPDVHLNLGFLLVADRQWDDAAVALARSVALRPVASPAWWALGRAEIGRGRPDAAAEAFLRVLAIDPTAARAYVAAGQALLAAGRRDEALRTLRHGARVARDPELVRSALQEAEGAAGPHPDPSQSSE